jgi:hypothetical protein
VRARGERLHELGDDRLGRLVVGDLHDHPDDDQADRAVEVEVLADLGVVEDVAGVAQVGGDHSGGAVVGEEGAAVREDHGVVVHVDDPRLGVDLLCRFVRVLLGRQAAADVEDLVDAAAADHVLDAADEGRTVEPCGLSRLGDQVREDLGGLAVDLEVVPAAEERVVHARGRGDGGVDPQRRPLRSCVVQDYPIGAEWAGDKGGRGRRVGQARRTRRWSARAGPQPVWDVAPD